MLTGASAVPSARAESDGAASSHAVVAAATADVAAVAVDVINGDEDEVEAGDEEELDGVDRRMSVRWPSYQALVSSSIMSLLPPIRNAKSVFLFFAAAVVFSKVIRAPWLVSISFH